MVGSCGFGDRQAGCAGRWRRRATFGASCNGTGSAAWVRAGVAWWAVVGDGVQRASLPHALAFVIDDHSPGGRFALKAHLDGPVRQVAWGFKADGLKGESVVGAHVALFLDEEQFIVGFVGWKKTDSVTVQAKRSKGVMPRTEWICALYCSSTQ